MDVPSGAETSRAPQRRQYFKRLPLRTEDEGLITLGQVAKIEIVQQVGLIARESGERRVAILINNAGRDTESFVEEAQVTLRDKMEWPDGYYFEFGGQFENLIKAKQRLTVVVPMALALIFILIFMSFGSFRQAALIFTCVPLAVTGGIFAIYLRGMPFTISAAVGFIAVFGVAVLNGVVMVSYINQLRDQGHEVMEAVKLGAKRRLRPVLMTASVAILGLVPLLLADGIGSNVQRPLATVVVGGLITSTLLTLVVLPSIYQWFAMKRKEVDL